MVYLTNKEWLVDKQQLNDRINTIRTEMETLKANYSKLEGHLNESLHWMTELNKKEFEAAQLKELKGKEKKNGKADKQSSKQDPKV
jgi:regulator of replication initiation timing